MIDWGRVDVLRNEISADDFEEVVALFLEEVEEIIERLRTTPFPTSLEADLHCLKGSALNLGFAEFSSLCDAGERLAALGETAQVNVDAIISSFDASKELFLKELADAP